MKASLFVATGPIVVNVKHCRRSFWFCCEFDLFGKSNVLCFKHRTGFGNGKSSLAHYGSGDEIKAIAFPLLSTKLPVGFVLFGHLDAVRS